MVGMHRSQYDEQLKDDIRRWGSELGFAAVGFSAVNEAHGARVAEGLAAWLAAGFHGEMDYMAAHGPGGTDKRAHPARLLAGTRSVITARMNYRTGDAGFPATLADPERAILSRYALGRDYHKLLRARLQQLADRITQEMGEFGYRVFTDSAPVMEVEQAQRSGLGWRGKNTLLLNREAGSYFFLGEILTDLELPPDLPEPAVVTDHCGTCTACIDSCPTQAIVAPYRLDARKCISYLTIELKSPIPETLRPAMGNRIYGCDDCQSVCPWNRFSPLSTEADFAPRQGLERASLADLFAWDEADFNHRLAGSAIRRIGYERWLRNIAVALGNAPSSEEIVKALRSRADHSSAQVREHVAWALAQHGLPTGYQRDR